MTASGGHVAKIPSCSPLDRHETFFLLGRFINKRLNFNSTWLFFKSYQTFLIYFKIFNLISTFFNKLLKNHYSKNQNYSFKPLINNTNFSSTDHRKVIGFSFDSNEAALELWQCVERLVSNPENIALSSPGRKKRSSSKQKRSKQQVALPPKSQISHPCQFLHVTKVTAYDTPRFYSLQAFVAPSHRHKDY